MVLAIALPKLTLDSFENRAFEPKFDSPRSMVISRTLRLAINSLFLEV